MLIVDVEEVIIKFLKKQGVIKQDQVGNKERLEGIVQVGDKLEIVDGHESDKLHVLNQDPKWQESNSFPE